jgi:hypothetical protein
MLIGLIVALLSAATINLGFLLQHQGLRERAADASGALGTLRAVWRSRPWMAGQALGAAGYAAQIAAVAIAPLSLVQAFAAGGLALSVPLAAGLFGHRIDRSRRIAILIIAGGLALLPVGLARSAETLHGGSLLLASIAAATAAAACATSKTPALRAVAAGLLYGVADASIKAVAVTWSGAGAASLLTGWTVLALAGTLGGFLAFQSALRDGDAVSGISLSTVFATFVALLFGVIAFGESIGSGPALIVLHLAAVGAVLACVPGLASAQLELTELDPGTASGRDRGPHPQDHGLTPGAGARRPRPQDAAKGHVARDRKGLLREEEQQHQPQSGEEPEPPAPRQRPERHPRDYAGR